jgi:hypothetical protein
MAQLAGTTDTYDLKGQREDLMNKIFMITPEDTPFMSNIGRNRGSAVRHEWQTDVLAAPDTSNAQIEGDEYVYADRSPTVRVGNLMQISRKPVNISRTLEVVDKAGRQSEVAYQVAKAGKELKKDMEAILLANQASVVGNNSTARKLGGFAAWLTLPTSPVVLQRQRVAIIRVRASLWLILLERVEPLPRPSSRRSSRRSTPLVETRRSS